MGTTVYSIGIIKNIDNNTSKIILDEKLKEGLEHLEKYSHIVVIYYLNKVLEEDRRVIKIKPHHDDIPVLGVFATRFPARPNPIGLYVVKILKIDGNEITISKIDAMDGTPVIDIKPYIPKFDMPNEEIKLPDWVEKHLKEKHEHKHSYKKLRKMIVERF
ncbi:tRNA (N6-threonylcarbamoyladenosine(37)-N6)-methyltransferase TrmO [Methanotorris formicicus]|uniref:Uncharacterized protein family UPF0066 n=1 Tax=Methanotorris formicicus Mc-S-70 TaxID=647171 RepID=H1L0P0_9EURY|nr:tRNA (N6-threonylcarbamoyladenosine(37)-N6)-methyltransferase TrmO [Methanotorris formicicus]EHP84584.1 Uncharacterized protein family UPF0066 [Methanotorris formicicus Mc-S-70]